MIFQKLLLIIFSVLFLSGCSILNPYNEEFLCPNTSKGICTTVENAYFNSNNINSPLSPQPEQTISNQTRNVTLASIIGSPEQPIITPPKIARVLILPYSAKNGTMMYGERYAYIIVKQASFDVLATNTIE
ncbi:MAG: TraV family lipoprotein [Desulforegulaceae bacterium]|nr:TraV family lipoprotein [Desulforegulaceae bacterium]